METNNEQSVRYLSCSSFKQLLRLNTTVGINKQNMVIAGALLSIWRVSTMALSFCRYPYGSSEVLQSRSKRATTLNCLYTLYFCISGCCCTSGHKISGLKSKRKTWMKNWDTQKHESPATFKRINKQESWWLWKLSTREQWNVRSVNPHSLSLGIELGPAVRGCELDLSEVDGRLGCCPRWWGSKRPWNVRKLYGELFWMPFVGARLSPKWLLLFWWNFSSTAAEGRRHKRGRFRYQDTLLKVSKNWRFSSSQRLRSPVWVLSRLLHSVAGQNCTGVRQNKTKSTRAQPRTYKPIWEWNRSEVSTTTFSRPLLARVTKRVRNYWHRKT